MRVRDIMTTNVVSCQKDADIGVAGRLMLEGEFGTLPVLDSNGRLAGIITDRDIAIAAAVRHRNASHIAVHEAMSDTVRSCFADDEIGAALQQMADGHVRRLPVLDASAHLAGIVSIDDIVSRAIDRPGGVTPAQLVEALRQICSVYAH
jgi:CBS domain-containing protein